MPSPGKKTGFAYSNAITQDALVQAARAARSISRAGQNGRVQAFSSPVVSQLYGPDNPLEVLTRAERSTCSSASTLPPVRWTHVSSKSP